MAFNKTLKSDRILQSRRFTQDKNPDSSEVFTRVLDLNASEIYAQQNLIPAVSLPFSASDQNGYYFTSAGQISTTSTGEDILRYRYRQRLTPSNTYNDGEGTTQNTWFFLNTYAGDTGVSPGILQATQGVNFVSPKYAPTQGNNAEQNPPGYQVILTQGGTLIDSALYTFDYKTGVIEFNGQSGLTNLSDIRLTAYQYVGRTLSSDQTSGYSGSFSGSFQGSGAGLTAIPASGIVGLNLTQIATSNVTASVTEGSTSFTLTNTGTPLLTVGNTGTITAAGSASFKDTTITGSLLVTQNLRVLGTASFTSVTSSQINVGASIITLSTDDPVVRFGGMVVRDSGSFGLNSTASFLYDSEKNQWLFQHEGAGEQTGSSIAIFGPLNEGNLGDEQGLAEYTIPRTYTNHGHHIGNSNIFSTGSSLTLNNGEPTLDTVNGVPTEETLADT